MVSRTEWAARPRRESLRKRLGLTAHRIEARDHFRCLYCKRTAAESGAHLHIDHLIPRKQGGPDLPTNLVMACRSCNSSRQQMPVRDWAKLRQIPARMIWAQARRSLPTIEEVRAARGGLTVIQGGRKAASPAGHAGGGKGGFELMRCIAPASAGAGEKLCGKTAREEALVDGVYCPLCPGHAAELAREDAEARGESAPMAVAASPRKMTKAKRAW